MCYVRRVSRDDETRLFSSRLALIGAVHVPALPGTPRGTWPVARLVEAAVADARRYVDGGVDALIVENMHDRPYPRGAAEPEVVAAMTMAVAGVRAAVAVPIGVQILAAADREAVAVAYATGASFVRVECFAFAHVGDEGIHQSNAAGLLRYRKAIGADGVRVLADVKKKHSAHALTADVGIAEAARAAEFFLADGVIVTGVASGRPAERDEVAEVKAAVRVPVLVGSGITAENIDRYGPADGFIVGTSLKEDGDWTRPVDTRRVRALVAARDALAAARRG
jgi:membrane complex biogenesis BtpA family protein